MALQEESRSDSEDEELCVWAGARPLWVSGVRASTTCGQLVQALLDAGAAGPSAAAAAWRITERWRQVEQPLDPRAPILAIWQAWGDAQPEIRFNLRYSGGDSSGDSGRGSPPCEPRGRRRGPDLGPLRAQAATLRRQASTLREQDKQIGHLEEQTHRSRMAKHGPDYLLESYLRDVTLAAEERANPADDAGDEAEDCEEGSAGGAATGGESPAGNSDSGVGTARARPRAKRGARARRLLQEHYLTRELAGICRLNAARAPSPEPLDPGDELSQIRREADMLEKLAIVNRRLQREEELAVRLGAKLRRYLCEGQIESAEDSEAAIAELHARTEQAIASERACAAQAEIAGMVLEERRNLLKQLTAELHAADLEAQALVAELQQSEAVPVFLREQPRALDTLV